MIDGYRVVTVTPAGRRRYLEILVPYLLKNKDVIDQHRFWVNTCNEDDLDFIEQTVSSDPWFFAADYLDNPRPDWTGNQRVKLIREFFPNCVDDDTVYVRLDDDICWIGDNSIADLVHFRIANPEFFLVYPVIINNGYVAQIHSDMGLMQTPEPDAFRKWQRLPSSGQAHHELFFDMLAHDSVGRLKFDSHIIDSYAPAPINCISWLGRDFAKFGGVVADEACDWMEEVWLTTIKPKELSRPNCVFGGALVAHFAFNTQRRYLEQETNLLELYEVLAAYGGQSDWLLDAWH